MTTDNHRPTDSLTARLVGVIQGKPIIDEDLEACTLFVLDAIANAVAARDTAVGRVLLQWWRAHGHADPMRLALLAGGLTHTLEMDDLHKQSVTHPGCVVVPAALAVATREGRSGRETLIAILKGYEAMCRVGNAVGRAHYRIWHSTATCGPFGAAMAAGDLLDLGAAQLIDALGNAGTQSAGLWEFMNSGGMSKHLHAGRAAEAGILAADLARAGFTGPADILEGRQGLFAASCPDADPAAIDCEPDGLWELRRTSIKPWPCCRHTHPAIDAALELAGTLTSPPRTVTLKTYRAALDVCDRPQPVSDYEAKFSLQHCVAIALTQGRVDFGSFDDRAREAVRMTRAQVRVELSGVADAGYPRDWGCDLEVVCEDGTTRRATRTHCKGDPELPLDHDAMIAKARMLLTTAGLDAAAQQQLINTVLGMSESPHAPGLAELLAI